MAKKIVFFIAATTITGLGCKKPFAPAIVAANNSYLVVEGVINPGADSTIIKLSRTVNVSSKITGNPLQGAAVIVESDQNAVYPLIEAGIGNYISTGLNLDKARNYRLRIKTSDNQEYLSDFVPVKITPPIDSIGFNVNPVNNSLQVYANTHDATNSTHYYRWDYDEAWQFQAKYISNYISDGSQILVRQPSQNITICYTNDISSDVVLGSSSNLQQDNIYQNPIAQVPSTSEKIEMKYSILVRQYALTSAAYTFWTELRKNTEQLGSIFDAQPSQIESNIHCISNTSLPVIGYISVCTVPSKRVFISKNQLPDEWRPTYPYSCPLDTVHVGSDLYINTIVLNPDLFIPIDGFPPLTPSVYTTTSRECADCTIRGKKQPPPFWQ
ncbi:DUF4249 domain-containing protein [Mucilaginibacter sp. McL0603]|uniref:DUF4249 domain-containing protein n=1 Tax=Mucilaginibacter sp. McL0603 TaxID=3415670 RepID=UPI003CEBE4DB